MIIGLIESTTYTSPRHSKDSGETLEKGSVICGPSPPPLSNQMELEEKDDDDEEVAIINFESKGKTDSSQTNNQMTFSLPLKEGPTSAESITNKKSGENQ